MNTFKLLTTMSIALLIAALAAGQSRLPNHRISSYDSWFPAVSFGDHIHGLSDMDGDGWADYAVSAPSHSQSGAMGSVYLVSGRTGAFFLQIDNGQLSAAFGAVVFDTPDITGDGQRDLIISAPDHDTATVNNAGRVAAYSGADGSLIWGYDGSGSNTNLGISVGAIGTATVLSSIVVGEPGYVVPGVGTGAGRVVYLDPVTGLFQDEEEGPLAFSGFGAEVAARPGVGGLFAASSSGRIYSMDGPFVGTGFPTLFEGPLPGGNTTPQLDIVAGSSPGSTGLVVGRRSADSNGFTNNGSITFYGGGSGVVIYEGTFNIANAGTECIAIRDWNGDGDEEIGFSVSNPSSSITTDFNIIDTGGTILETISRAPGGQHFSSIPDVTGDGRGELLVGIAAGLSLEYEATMFSQGLGPANFTTGAGGSLTVDQTIGMTPAHGGALYAQGYSATGASPGVLLQAGAPLLPLVPDGLTQTGISLAGSSFLPDAVGNLDVNGFKTTTLNVDGATAASISGVSIFTAVAVFDGTFQLAAVSNPREITFP